MLGNEFNQKINKWPEKINYVSLGRKYNRKLKLPSTIVIIELNPYITIQISKSPTTKIKSNYKNTGIVAQYITNCFTNKEIFEPDGTI